MRCGWNNLRRSRNQGYTEVNVTENQKKTKQQGAKPKPKGMHSLMNFVNLFCELVPQISFKFLFFVVNNGQLKMKVVVLSMDAHMLK